MAIREGRWDCQYCATKGVLGRHKSCPVCFAARPAGTRFYLLDDTEAVTAAELLGYAQKGPDWVCAFCGTSNPANIRICTNCQSERSVDAHTQVVKEYQPGEAPDSGDMDLDNLPTPLDDRREPTPQPSRVPTFFAAVAGVVVLACIGIFIARNFISNELSASVATFEWERTIDVEELRTVEEEDWNIPPDGRYLSDREEIQRYDQIITGYTTETQQVSEQVYVGDREYVCGQRDLGNGFFEDIMCSEAIYETQFRSEQVEVPIFAQVPVYETLYLYEIDKWIYVRTESSAGRDQEVFWPETNLGEFERETNRQEQYIAVFVDQQENRYPLELPFQQWANLSERQDYALDVNAFGEVRGLIND